MACGSVSPVGDVFIRLEDRLQSNTRFTLWRILAVFMHSAITPPKLQIWSTVNNLSGAGCGTFWARSVQ